MGPIAPVLGAIGTIASIGGTVLGAIGQVQQGKYQAAAAEASAQAENQRAQEERATSQREAISRSREANLVMSRQLALAAAGGGAGDSTVLNLMAQTANQGQYNASNALYAGDVRGQGLDYQASVDRAYGNAAKTAGYINAGSTVLGGVPSFLKYQVG